MVGVECRPARWSAPGASAGKVVGLGDDEPAGAEVDGGWMVDGCPGVVDGLSVGDSEGQVTAAPSSRAAWSPTTEQESWPACRPAMAT